MAMRMERSPGGVQGTGGPAHGPSSRSSSPPATPHTGLDGASAAPRLHPLRFHQEQSNWDGQECKLRPPSGRRRGGFLRSSTHTDHMHQHSPPGDQRRRTTACVHTDLPAEVSACVCDHPKVQTTRVSSLQLEHGVARGTSTHRVRSAAERNEVPTRAITCTDLKGIFAKLKPDSKGYNIIDPFT